MQVFSSLPAMVGQNVVNLLYLLASIIKKSFLFVLVKKTRWRYFPYINISCRTCQPPSWHPFILLPLPFPIFLDYMVITLGRDFVGRWSSAKNLFLSNSSLVGICIDNRRKFCFNFSIPDRFVDICAIRIARVFSSMAMAYGVHYQLKLIFL